MSFKINCPVFFIEKLTDHFWKVRSNPKSFAIGKIGKIGFTMEFLTAASALVPLASSLFINMLSINVGEFFLTLVETVICGGGGGGGGLFLKSPFSKIWVSEFML